MVAKTSATTTLEGRSNYGSSIPDSPRFTSNDYVSSSSRDYGQKVDQLYSDRILDYPSIDRHQYDGRHRLYVGRDLPSETVGRYTDSVAFGQEHQVLKLNVVIYFFKLLLFLLWSRLDKLVN